MNHFTLPDVPRQDGRVFIVTGANTGLGFEIAKGLAGKGAKVLLACRDEGKAQAAIARIASYWPQAELSFLPLDQADLDSVRAAAEIAKEAPRIDVLVNNAGVMAPPLSRTRQGFELQFGVNHLGSFALTALLLDKLAEGKDPRVVVTSSLAHRNADADYADPEANQGYDNWKRYGQSKLANMLHFYELDRRLRAAGSPVKAIGCHPGVAATELMRHSGAMQRVLPLFEKVLNSASQGAWPALQAATDPMAHGGDYYGPQGIGGASGPSGIARRTPLARDPQAARQLWDRSVELTGIDPGLPPA